MNIGTRNWSYNRADLILKKKEIKWVSVFFNAQKTNISDIFASFYSNAFIGVVKWYAINGTDESLEDIYSFLEARVDELCSTYTQKYV